MTLILSFTRKAHQGPAIDPGHPRQRLACVDAFEPFVHKDLEVQRLAVKTKTKLRLGLKLPLRSDLLCCVRVRAAEGSVGIAHPDLSKW